jgi:DNA-binding GntR family transcriptional regulator
MEAALERDDATPGLPPTSASTSSWWTATGGSRASSAPSGTRRTGCAWRPWSPKPVNSTADHRAVVEAIVRREPHAAREIHRLHRIRGGETLLDILGRYRLDAL